MTQSDNMIRKYLLNALGEDEQQRIEEMYFTDALFLEEVEIVEDELIEDYLRNVLSPEERELFERHCLPTPRCAGKLEVAQAMQAVAQRTPVNVTHTPRPSPPVHPSLWLRQPALKYALGAAFFLVCLAALWLWSREAQKSGESLKAQERRIALEQMLAGLNREDEANRNADTTGTTYAFTPLPLQLRDDRSTSTLNSPAGASVIRFRLILQTPSRENLTVAFLSDRDEELFTVKGLSSERLEGGGSRLDVRIPKEALQPGSDYQISVRANDAANSQAIADYYFRVGL